MPSMNLIDGDLSQEGDRWLFRSGNISVPVGPLIAEARSGDACLGVRPENLLLGEGPTPGVVQLVERTGHENIVVVEVEGGFRMTGRVPASSDWQTGETIRMSIQSEAAHVFAAGPTGKRLNIASGAARP
jgi:ABC-type sugar transport system ATPase subunit